MENPTRTISGIKELPKKTYKRLLERKAIILAGIEDDEKRREVEEEFGRIEKEHQKAIRNPYRTELDEEEMARTMLRIVGSGAFSRLSSKTMAHSSLKVSSEKTNKRMLHSVRGAMLMLEYCLKTDSNALLGMSIMLEHDTGHTAFGHTGDHIYNKLCQKYGAGVHSHNIQGSLVMTYIEGKDIAIQTIDGGQCHNGETGELETIVNYDKTPRDVQMDLIKSSALKGYERKQKAGTFEGGSAKFIDKISYVGQDLADGFREKIPDEKGNPRSLLNPRNLDPELKGILEEIGLTEERINQLLSQDPGYSMSVIDRICNQLQNIPLITVSEGKELQKVEEAINNLNQLKEMDFNDGPTFNRMISKTANILEKLSKSVNLSEFSQHVLLLGSRNLNDLMSQDTSGGRLAEEIEMIFLNDLAENSIGKQNPRMSEKMGDLMHDLIGYTQENVLPYISFEPEYEQLLEESMDRLIQHYASVLLASGVIDEIYPQYANEERDQNKDAGIWDNIEKHQADSKIEGHIRKLYAQDIEHCGLTYFDITDLIINTAIDNEAEIKLTMREKIAVRMAKDYAARNSEKQIIEKLAKKKLITTEEHKMLSNPKRPKKIQILPGTSLYSTRTGMQKDRIERKLKIIKDVDGFIERKLSDSSMSTGRENLANFGQKVKEARTVLQGLSILYYEKVEFPDKKYLYEEFKKKYKEIRELMRGYKKRNVNIGNTLDDIVESKVASHKDVNKTDQRAALIGVNDDDGTYDEHGERGED